MFYTDRSRHDGKQPLCKVCHKEVINKFIQDNPEKRKKVTKKYRDANIDKCKSASLKSRSKEQGKKKAKEWIAKNRDKVKSYKSTNLGKRRGAQGKHTVSQVTKLYERQQGKCACCHADLSDGYHRDHIKPVSLGGSNDIYNIQLLCKLCNLRKGSKDPIDFMQAVGYLL
jgi:5-methylcytosine-specific restriction endonuclease McrA